MMKLVDLMKLVEFWCFFVGKSSAKETVLRREIAGETRIWGSKWDLATSEQKNFHGIFHTVSPVWNVHPGPDPIGSHLRQETSCGVNSGGAFRSILGPNSSDSSAYSSSLEWLHASTISRSHVVKPIQAATIWSSDLYHPSMVIWVCLKIGYTPNYSHLIGIMIINHWV